ncbi:MAG: KilA-N domain-containing protein [Saprospiraceae bacterium]
MKKQKINVNGVEVQFYQRNEVEFISLTDIAKKFNANSDVVIQNWLRTGDTLDYLALWESLHNPNFNKVSFEEFRKRAGSGGFFISPKQWIEKTAAVGIESRTGRGGGTYAQTDIALEFCSSLSAAFKLYLVKEFQRLKAEEPGQKGLTWDVYRLMGKANYHIHTEAVRQSGVPIMDWNTKREAIYQASEADLINIVVFGCTAKQWRQSNPEAKGNIRDSASALENLVLNSIQILNAELLEQNVSKEDRLVYLQAKAAHHYSILAHSTPIKQLEEMQKKLKGKS